MGSRDGMSGFTPVEEPVEGEGGGLSAKGPCWTAGLSSIIVKGADSRGRSERKRRDRSWGSKSESSEMVSTVGPARYFLAREWEATESDFEALRGIAESVASSVEFSTEFIRVGTRVCDGDFLTWIAFAEIARATIELVLFASPLFGGVNSWAPRGGVAARGVPVGVVWPEPVLTLTTAALPRRAVCVGLGLMTAVSRSTVVTTLSRARSRARLGVMLCRDSLSERSDQVESRKSPGIKKCCSWLIRGVELGEELIDASGNGGTGGAMILGLSGGDRLVTPGI